MHYYWLSCHIVASCYGIATPCVITQACVIHIGVYHTVEQCVTPYEKPSLCRTSRLVIITDTSGEGLDHRHVLNVRTNCSIRLNSWAALKESYFISFRGGFPKSIVRLFNILYLITSL
ncbi:hypothetical protein Plhal304r1_c015g0055621 [Plasmopara halstedii]